MGVPYGVAGGSPTGVTVAHPHPSEINSMSEYSPERAQNLARNLDMEGSLE